MELKRSEILRGNYIFPTDLIQLKQTKHAKERILERYNGLFIIVPEYVRVTKNNIHSAKCDDGKHLHSVVVRLNYSYHKFLFICCNPFDGALKTLWLTDKKRKHRGNITQHISHEEDNQRAIQDDRSESQVRRLPRRWGYKGPDRKEGSGDEVVGVLSV